MSVALPAASVVAVVIAGAHAPSFWSQARIVSSGSASPGLKGMAWRVKATSSPLTPAGGVTLPTQAQCVPVTL